MTSPAFRLLLRSAGNRLTKVAAAAATSAALTTLLPAGEGRAADLRVMTTGLGTGTVKSSPAGINCGATCNATFAPLQTVKLAAVPGANSAFAGWDTDQNADPQTTPDCVGMAPICTLSMNVARSVRPRFRSTVAVVPFADLTPTGIANFLASNPGVDTPAEFIAALQPVFRENWILMSRSESLQTGTAQFPRLLLFNGDATSVFSVGMVRHGSFPGSDPHAIEYMQWDPAEKNFRFHEIVLAPIGQMGSMPPRTRKIAVDDVKCSKCHSTQNVQNTTSLPGTNGIPPGTVKVKNKPNWDTYDSWGAMLPFNRDRIYNGSVEAAAIRKVFNPWTWRSRPAVRALIEQLKLQPSAGTPAGDMMWRMRGGAKDGQIRFAFDGTPPGVNQRESPPQFGAGSISTNYNFDGMPGTGAATQASQEGAFITLQQSPVTNTSEGRGVQLFDLLGGLDGQPNALRIADELVGHRFATGSVPIDVRPIALAVLDGCITFNSGNGTLNANGLAIDLNFFRARNGMNEAGVVNDTFERVRAFPRRKADFQRFNLDRASDPYVLGSPELGLIQRYLANIYDPSDVGLPRVRKEVFRRSGGNDQSVMGGIYVDRETYPSNYLTIGLARFFLEPLGVSVDKWSLNVRGRSRSYTFADVLGSNLNRITPVLRASLGINTTMGNSNYCPTVIGLVNSTLGPGKLPGAGDVPKFTDVQRIFNKSCIECHGGLRYPPYENFGTGLDLSENEAATGGPNDRRMTRSYDAALARAMTLNGPLFLRITNPVEGCDSSGAFMMPFCGPALSKADIETVRRWVVGGNPYTEGDPHITTVDGVSYDFQGAGEYVLLRDEGMELQARHSPVATAGPLGPNGYTGLTSCVSINSAVALRLGADRISYQPRTTGEPDPSGLELRINGKEAERGFEELILPSGGRVTTGDASGALNFQSQGGTTVTITPQWWNSQQVWFMNINVRQARGTDGLMGAIPPGSWLPALPDGSPFGPMPAGLQDRYDELYSKFGNAWRVDKDSSLFDYAPWLTPSDFVDEAWPMGESPKVCEPGMLPNGAKPLPAGEPIDVDTAIKICDGVADKTRLTNCVLDVSVTGEKSFAEVYRQSEGVARVAETKLVAPVLARPDDFQTDLSGVVSFAWRDGGAEVPGARDRFCLWREDQEFGFNVCDKEVPSTNRFDVQGLETGTTYFWKVIVESEDGAIQESETRRITMR